MVPDQSFDFILGERLHLPVYRLRREMPWHEYWWWFAYLEREALDHEEQRRRRGARR